MKIKVCQWLWIAPMALTLGCSKMAFEEGPPVSSKGACLPGQKTEVLPTKVIFLVDMSGSNVDGPYDHPGVATDPTKSRRLDAINTFLQKYSSVAAFSWSFITFNNGAAASYTNDSTTLNPTFSNSTAMASALQSFQAATDTGGTPYKSALTMAQNLIANDMATAAPQTQYRIAMLSDGYPTDYCPGGISVYICPGQVLDNVLMSDVQNLVNTAPGATQLSTIYYGLPDAEASARLQNMSVNGLGKFVDTNSAGTINLNNLIQVSTGCM